MKKFNLRFLILPILSIFFAISLNAQMAPKTTPTPSRGFASVTSVSQIKDVKKSDKFYPALESLVERYGCFSPYADYTFRANDPLTREAFVVLFNNCLDRLNELAAASNEDFDISQLYNNYSAAGTNLTSISQLNDIKASYEYYLELQSSIERYGVDISDADKNFRPNKSVSEKEFYEWIGKIFGASIDGTPSATKMITRGEFIVVMNSAIEADSDKIAEFQEASEVGTRKKLIENLPSKGKAKITDRLKFYLPDSTCADLTNASRELKTAFEKGGIWGDYKIKLNDIGDIVFETNNTCQKGEKLVLLRIGTAIVTIQEKGIKRVK
jgi:S-layer homology domain